MSIDILVCSCLAMVGMSKYKQGSFYSYRHQHTCILLLEVLLFSKQMPCIISFSSFTWHGFLTSLYVFLQITKDDLLTAIYISL